MTVCLDDMFEQVIEDLNEDSFDTISATWPTLAQLLINGINDKYQHGAFIKLEDADYGDNKWFLASIAGNISFDSEENLFCDRATDTIGVVLSRANDLFSELQERKPSMFKAIGKGILTGLGIGLLSSAAQVFA